MKHQSVFDILLLCAAFGLGIDLLKNCQNLPKDHISNFIAYKNRQPYTVKGFIEEESTLKNNRACFVFKVSAIKLKDLYYNCSGNILVCLKAKEELRYGQVLILKGHLYRRGGILVFMKVKNKADIIDLGQNQGLIIRRFSLGLKHRLENIFLRHSSPLTAAILSAMILGDKKRIPWLLNNSMMKSGTLHILVVSGFNVAIVTYIIALFLKILRLPRKIRISLTIAFLVIYCLITGASNPVVRATIMGIIFISAYLFKREYDIYNSLAIAALFILMHNPYQLFDAGFQLSFASVFSIIAVYPKIKAFLRVDSLKIKALKYVLNASLVSFSAWLGTMGFIACYFRIFSPVTVLANLFIVPLATLITLCGFGLIFISLVFPLLSPFFACANELLATLLINTNSLLIKLPAAYFPLK